MIDIEQRMASFCFFAFGRVNTNQERVRVFFYVSLGIGAYEKVKMHKESPGASGILPLFVFFPPPKLLFVRNF